MSGKRTIRVAMAGCGTVGCGVGDLLIRDHDELEARTGLDIRLVHAVARDMNRSRAPHVPDELVGDDLSVLNHADIDIVVEVIGGTTVAREVVLSAIAAGKDVVTANKALLALHGPEVYAAARRAGVGVAFEASVAGGVPVIGVLQRGMAANRINAIEGIFNTTCNYILTQMLQAGVSFADALADAQQLGYAEADPTLDIDGSDTGHKLAILAMLAFGTHVDYSAVSVEGIERITLVDLQAGHALGLACKLLGTGRQESDGLMLRVEPVFLAGAHPLAEVSGKGSGVCCYGHASDVVTVMGTGAGGPATASAVVSDIVEVALGNWRRTFLQWPVFGAALPAQTAPAGAVPDSRFYIRCAPREPRQATTQITAVLRDQGVEALRVELLDGMACAPDRSQVVVLTAPLPPGKMPTVLAALEERVDLLEPPVSLPLIEPS